MARIHVPVEASEGGIQRQKGITQQTLAALEGRVVLHFLPPYCPQENRIERLWQDLHANVTRNHTRSRMQDLMADVRRYLNQRSTQPASSPRLAA